MLAFATAALLVLTADQATKAAAVGWVGWGGSQRIAGALWLRPRLHRGAWLNRPAAVWVETLLWLAALAGALVYLRLTTPGPFVAGAVGAALGGGAGNHLDRLRHGGIVDFLDLGRGIFNLADVALIGGLVVAAVRVVAAAWGMG